MDSQPIYNIRRQVAPLTSTNPSLQHYMEFTQRTMNTPEGTIFCHTSVPMGRGIAAILTWPLIILPTMYTTANLYTRPSVAFLAISNPPSLRSFQEDLLDLQKWPSSANQRLVRYSTNPPIILHQRQVEINQLRHSQEELDSRLLCLLSNHALPTKQLHMELQPLGGDQFTTFH